MVPRMPLDGLVLTDEQWSRIAPLIPEEKRRPGLDPRMMVEAILWLARHGATWSALPREFGWPATVRDKFVRWKVMGRWPAIIAALADDPALSYRIVGGMIVSGHRPAEGANARGLRVGPETEPAAP